MDYELEGCGGCKTCEIACSFKHTGSFNHSISSIEIVEREDGKGYFIRIHDDSSSGRIPCDGCLDVDGEPMCVVYCHKREGLLEIINQFIEETGLSSDKE